MSGSMMDGAVGLKAKQCRSARACSYVLDHLYIFVPLGANPVCYSLLHFL